MTHEVKKVLKSTDYKANKELLFENIAFYLRTYTNKCSPDSYKAIINNIIGRDDLPNSYCSFRSSWIGLLLLRLYNTFFPKYKDKLVRISARENKFEAFIFQIVKYIA
jgi:hypothetical protein